MQASRRGVALILFGLACHHETTTSRAPAIAQVQTPSAPTLDQAAFDRHLEAAMAAYQRGDHAACQQQFAPIVDDPRASGDIAYNAACCAALAGDLDAAFAQLELALARGLRDADHLERDTDLAALHQRDAWTDLVARTREAQRRHADSLHPELAQIFREDQGDRLTPGKPIDWSVVAPRDVERRRRVLELMDAGAAKVADDYYHAAMVLQHGESAEDYQLAQRWAEQAVALDPNHGRARWLAAAALDRYLMKLGKPQRFGTQYVRVDGTWTLYDYDPTVTDEERAAAGVPSLAQAKAQAAQLNASP